MYIHLKQSHIWQDKTIKAMNIILNKNQYKGENK